MLTLKQVKHDIEVCSDRLTGIEITITHKKHTAYYAQLLKEVIETLYVITYELKQIK